MIVTMPIPYPWWQHHGYLGLGLVLHIRGQYEELGRTGEELLLCKEQLKNYAIRKLKDHDKGQILKSLKAKQTYSQSKFLFKPFGGGESMLSKSIIRHFCSGVGTWTNGFSTLVKMSMSNSRTNMWWWRVWHALMLFLVAQMEVKIRNGTRRKHGIFEIKKGRCKFVDVDKFARNEPALDTLQWRPRVWK